MEAEHIQEINNINVQINKMKADHELFVQKLEASYNEKLIIEYDKYLAFENKMDQMLKEKDLKYHELKLAKETSEEALHIEFMEKIKEKDLQYEEVILLQGLLNYH